MTLHQEMLAIGDQARAAARRLGGMSTRERSDILLSMADQLEKHRAEIKAANSRDMTAGQDSRLSAALLDRLELTDKRIDGMIAGVRHVAELSDAVGEVLEERDHETGIKIIKRRVPIGVVAIIYESRPNVTADAGVLCIKSGNAVILRGGKEAAESNRKIADLLVDGGRRAGMPDGALQLIHTSDRDAVRELVQMEGRVDVVIPRGGEGLIRAVTEQARVPVIKHYKGVCHTYVHGSADLNMALAICENAKCQRPGVCNAMETLLVDRSIAEKFLPMIAECLGGHAVELRGDDLARKIVPSMQCATQADWDEEYLDMILSVRVVMDINDAIDHIERHGSHHSDAIVAEDTAAQEAFLDQVDSAAVYVNASTRFTDGAEFGMGAEIGISTDKLHARGPMGLTELTTYKFVVRGTGQVRP